MISRRDAAIRLDIPVEMATRHGIGARISAEELDELESSPPPWLEQSRRNRTSAPVWVTLTCDLCGARETTRPKKWWPDFSYLICNDHDDRELPDPADGMRRREVDGVGDRFIAIVDADPLLRHTRSD